MTLCRNEIPVGGNVVLDGRHSASVSLSLKALKAHGRVGDAVTQHGVERVRETRQHGLLGFAALVGMSFELESVLFQTPQLRAAHAGAALQLREIDPFKGEAFTGLPAHFIERVGDPGFIIQLAFCIFHCTSFPEPLSAQV